MSALHDRPNDALIVIDVQVGVVADAHERDGVVANIQGLVESARASDVPVIWIQHDDRELPAGTDAWQIVPELSPNPDEPVVAKNHRDSFQATTLEAELDRLGVGRLFVAGAQTDFCVRWTLHSALSRGYDTVLVGDAHTTDRTSPPGMPLGEELIAHTNSIWASQAHPECDAAVVETAAVRFS